MGETWRELLCFASWAALAIALPARGASPACQVRPVEKSATTYENGPTATSR